MVLASQSAMRQPSELRGQSSGHPGTRVFPQRRGPSRALKPGSSLTTSILLAGLAAAVAYVVLIEFATYTALFFCSVLMATAIAGVARWLSERTRAPYAAAMAVTLALPLLAVGGLSWWVGPQLVSQFDQLVEQVPRGLNEARGWFESSRLGQRASSEFSELASAAPSPKSMVRSTGRFLSTGFATVGDALIMIVTGLFLAASPGRYLRGAVRLLPGRRRRRGAEVLAAMGGALRVWLVARAALMLLITTLLGGGLLLIGIPLAVPLAIIAGLFAFVPYVGPLLAFIPSVAMGLLQSPLHGLYVCILYLGVQVVESYLVEPLVEARAVSLPPALIIASQVFITVWLGPIGVVIATPLLVVVSVAVQMLYLQDTLGDEVDVIGE